jgi:hypothetical protein
MENILLAPEVLDASIAVDPPGIVVVLGTCDAVGVILWKYFFLSQDMELRTFPEHLSSSSVFCRVCVVQSLLLCVVVWKSEELKLRIRNFLMD